MVAPSPDWFRRRLGTAPAQLRRPLAAVAPGSTLPLGCRHRGWRRVLADQRRDRAGRCDHEHPRHGQVLDRADCAPQLHARIGHHHPQRRREHGGWRGHRGAGCRLPTVERRTVSYSRWAEPTRPHSMIVAGDGSTADQRRARLRDQDQLRSHRHCHRHGWLGHHHRGDRGQQRHRTHNVLRSDDGHVRRERRDPRGDVQLFVGRGSGTASSG